MKRNRSVSSSEDMEPYRPAPRLEARIIDNPGHVVGPYVHAHQAGVLPKSTEELSKKYFFDKLKEAKDDRDTFDFTIICSGKEINVHRLVLSLQSGYFARLFKSDFKENVESKITLDKEPLAAVDAMIQFCYTFEYDGISSIQDHATMWTLGDKFEIPGLMEYAEQRFDSAYDATAFKPARLRPELTELLDVIPFIYNNTPPNTIGLRASVARCWNYLIACNANTIPREKWHELITDFPDFGVDVIMRLGKE